MSGHVLLDTGPLVASIDRGDNDHPWVTDRFRELPPPLLTCEPVLTEAVFLLRHLSDGGRRVLELVERKVIRIAFRLDDEFDAVKTLLTRYRNRPMSLADGCLVRMAELFNDASVLTLDSDFLTYRKNGRQVIPTIMPRHD